MSQENVEIVRRSFEAWNARDLDALRDDYDPGVIIARTLEGWPDGGEPTVGRDAVMRVFGQLREPWDSDVMEILDLIDAGDRVVVTYIWHGRGHGPDMDMEQTAIFTVRNDRIFLLEFSWGKAEAVQALGLAE
jgi:ketosteroid isomerase-like protein